MATTETLPQGWLTETEAEWLAQQASGKVVLEVGSYLGRSTVAMARSARRLVSVDTHVGPPVRSEGPTANDFLRNLQQFGVAEKVVGFMGDFGVVAPLLRADFELAFVDAAHDGLSVLRDGRAAYLLLRLGSAIVFHDYDVHVGVTSAVHELARRWGQTHQVIEGTSLAVLYKR